MLFSHGVPIGRVRTKQRQQCSRHNQACVVQSTLRDLKQSGKGWEGLQQPKSREQSGGGEGWGEGAVP